jgi:hypothetical protein
LAGAAPPAPAPAPPVPPAWPPAGLATASAGHWVVADAPRHHEAAVAHMLAHPGMSYEDTYTHVSGGH